MDLRRFDLNLLRVLDALLREQNVTRAAASLHVSQPALSAALAKLREEFRDDLFVRARGGVRPTQRAESLRPALAEAMQALRAMLELRPFVPADSDQRFRVYMSDLGQFSFLPALLPRLLETAPRVRLDVVSMPVESVGAALESGELDLALGFLPALESRRSSTLLFRDRYVALAPAGGGDAPLTLAAMRRATLALVAAPGTGHQLVERALERHRLADRVLIRVPNFLALPILVERAGVVAVMPQAVAQALGRQWAVSSRALPFALAGLDVSLHWHRRLDKDPANAWLRALVTATLPALGGSPPARHRRRL